MQSELTNQLHQLEAQSATPEQAKTLLQKALSQLAIKQENEEKLANWIGERLKVKTPPSIWFGLNHYAEKGEEFKEWLSMRCLDVTVPYREKLDTVGTDLDDFYDALTENDYLNDGLFKNPYPVTAYEYAYKHARLLRTYYALFIIKPVLQENDVNAFVLVGNVDLNNGFPDSEYAWFWLDKQ